jgi:hypothetical protein
MAQQDREKDPEVTLAENDYTERPKCFNSTLQECLFVLTATMAIGQQSFFQGCIVGVTASIGTDLNMNSAEITWINAGASYVLLSSQPFNPSNPIQCHIDRHTHCPHVSNPTNQHINT